MRFQAAYLDLVQLRVIALEKKRRPSARHERSGRVKVGGPRIQHVTMLRNQVRCRVPQLLYSTHRFHRCLRFTGCYLVNALAHAHAVAGVVGVPQTFEAIAASTSVGDCADMSVDRS